MGEWKKLLGCLVIAFAMGGGGALADDRPSIAVTDLTYEQSVSSYFSFVDAHSQSSAQASFGQFSASQSDSFTAASGEITQISRGELHKFTGDVKGSLLKSGAYRVTQGRPWGQVDTTTTVKGCLPPKCDTHPTTYTEQITIFDVIDRIKKGYYTGADYVLFGTISSIQSRNEAMPIQGSNAINYSLSMELMVEFSLINAKTYETVAGFSALGEGTDARLINTPGAIITLSRGKVMQAVSRSLGEAALNEIQTQFTSSLTPAGGKDAAAAKVKAQPAIESGKVIQFR